MSGPRSDLAAGEYRLERGAKTEAMAARWRALNQIRRTSGGGADGCLLLLRADHPVGVRREDLAYVALPEPLQAVLKDLEDAGWRVVEETDSRSESHLFRLKSSRRSAQGSRRIIQERESVLERDGRACVRCGAGSGGTSDVILEVHRSLKGTSGSSLPPHLETLCSACVTEMSTVLTAFFAHQTKCSSHIATLGWSAS